jgi:hypothetical protein
MKMRRNSRKWIQAVLVFVLLSGTLFSAQSALELYQRGLVQEQAHGNLREAIQLYQQAVQAAGGDRLLAAKALLREAESYRQMGDPKAAELYASLTRTYPEQREQVAAATAALAALPRAGEHQGSAGLSAPMASDLASVVAPVINNNCIGCHKQGRAYGGLSLDNLTQHFVANTSDFAADAPIWEKVVNRLRAREMPPRRGGYPLEEATNNAVIATLETALDNAYPTAPNSDLINDTELADRMAAFIWGSTPDPTLTNLAVRGHLRDAGVIDQQVKRMLASPKVEKLASGFFAGWLHLDSLSSILQPPNNPNMSDNVRQSILAEIERGKTLFPERTEDLLRAMRHETELFVADQLQQDRPALELWTANYTFMNDQLAAIYGIPNVVGNQFRRVTLTDDRRAGLLGQLSVLSATSLAARTSTVLRGKWIWTLFLGLPLPPPPPNVPPLDRTPGVQGGQQLTLRTRMETHHANPSCDSCHMMFEPLGDALGNFDVVGRWQETDAGQPIDTSGTLWEGTRFSGPAEMRTALLKYRDSYYWNVTSALLSNALGRQRFAAPGGQLYPYEQPAVRAILREARASNYSWTSIISGVVKSRPFQSQTVVP